jgi:23S rRNA (pseudouridine1915-N3)-methyltransferase
LPLKVTIIAVGKLKSAGLASVITELEKKLKHYVNITTIQTKDVRRSKQGGSPQAEEAKLILGRIPKDAYVVALDERGKLKKTSEMVDWWSVLERRCIGHVAFIIGGPDGLDTSVLSKADELLALSPLTFTHEMARFLLVEQLYRILSFRAGHPYHRV